MRSGCQFTGCGCLAEHRLDRTQPQLNSRTSTSTVDIIQSILCESLGKVDTYKMSSHMSHEERAVLD